MSDYNIFKARWQELRNNPENINNSKKEVAFTIAREFSETTDDYWRGRIRKKIEQVKYTSPTKAETMKAEEVAEVQRGILADLLGE